MPGLPDGLDWTFEFSAGWGIFGFGNSLYANSHDEIHPGPRPTTGWKGTSRAASAGTTRMSGGSELYGEVTGVGERTFNAPPPLVGGEASSFGVEDLYIGWRSGNSSDSARTPSTSSSAAPSTSSATAC